MVVNNIVMMCGWVSQLAYTLCFLPQIATNYRAKSGSGMSDLFLVGYFNLHAVTLFYAFLLNLPMAYKMCVPLQVTFILVLVVQRVWYDKAPFAKQLEIFYLMNIAVLLASVPYALANPIMVGHIAGWGNVTLGLVSQVPQAFKVWREQSVVGFDRSFVYVLLFAGSIELLGAVVGGLPMQTQFSSFRVVAFSLLFLWQFKQYSKTDA